jgi:adenylylsulfate kinase
MSAPENLHPTFDRLLSRADKEARLRQRARVIWLYGLSGSGKSTLANALERKLHAENFTTHLLDGDNVRTGLNRDLGFSDADRAENIRRVAEAAKLFVQAGVVVIAAFITPQRALRELARGIIGVDDFLEIYVSASFDECARRDPKGLYAKAGAGQVKQFTGRDSAFEPPAPGEPSLVLDTEAATPGQSLEKLHALVASRIHFS